VSTINKHISGLKMKCFEMPNASYTNRYAQAEKRQRHSKLTMKMNIKLVMNKETERLTARHTSRPDFFYFFCPPTFFSSILPSPHWHIVCCPDSQSQPFGKSQRANFANASKTDNQFIIVN
ncbi:MAG: hypothetical protein JXL97_02960, partial [Bacteroidales bacterium]|nr:hypothetical protein [Bacteroidales bacterium]